MKKTYLKPEMQVVEMKVNQMLTTSVNAPYDPMDQQDNSYAL